ncbi:hypothetical protein NFI96_005464, partial [Prochilodus magdalenae]
MELFDQTGGIHTWQWTIGCKLSEDGTKTGYSRYGYDGEDLLSLDLTTSTWSAANDKAVSIKQEWEKTPKATEQKNFLEKTCFEWLQKYVDPGREILERPVPPESSLFQKNSSSPVVCHATGFYPKLVNITWQQNGEDLDEGVELRETLPNQDGTFQRRSILTVSPEELDKHAYTCIIQHSSLEKEMMLHVVKHRAAVFIGIIIGAAVSALLIIIGVGMGVLVWMKRKKRRRRNLGSHFLDYFFTGVSPGTNCPEFTAVAHLDGLQAGYYECKSKILIFRQEWIKGIKDDEHWNLVTEYAKRFQYTVPDHAVKVMELFDQTG